MTENNINYKKASEYWAEIPATLDDNAPSPGTALDCGAGIGRITKHLLAPLFKKVDIIEPDEKFINTIIGFVGENKIKIGTLYKTSLQKFEPERKYDIIWNQWVLGYLTNTDLVDYLSCCRDALSSNGVLIVKENVASSGKPEITVDRRIYCRARDRVSRE
ncbi:N-terminal Xaa-Pro-Lys N-methyltransferase 1-A-like isoform X2 [Melitaea cinxia]|uniref:N-terminal Xaa-Pro-Lys N-methyltransferase 1-A-like isoform X2 n=1 Tax=Melitaea cinxia TaxID=113334 RepID=UPI001E26F9E7|nr:N-terminal Xaa-Pro-Lys N-methyltransferase 1-A-like isoform X2 [Melitaea cinxia]